jgi:hypothetical protein
MQTSGIIYPYFPNDPKRDRESYDIGRQWQPKSLARLIDSNKPKGFSWCYSPNVYPARRFRLYSSRVRKEAQLICHFNSLEKALKVQAEAIKRGWFIQGIPDYLRIPEVFAAKVN